MNKRKMCLLCLSFCLVVVMTAQVTGSPAMPAISPAAAAALNDIGLSLWYDKPAAVPSGTSPDSLSETGALPVGNGHMGAMVFGGVSYDTVLINEKTVWSGGPGAGFGLPNNGAKAYNNGFKNAAATNKMQLNLLRQKLQDAMNDFSATGAAYIDDSGRLRTQNYPATPWEVESGLKAYTTGDTADIGAYEELGFLRVSREELGDFEYTLRGLTSSEGNPGSTEGADKLFDGKVSTKFCTGKNPTAGNPVRVDWEYGGPVTINAYRMTTANDVVGRDPKNWKFMGSATGTAGSYTVIDEQTNYALPDARQTPTVFAVDDPAAYRYYRLEITAVKNAPESGWGCQLAEFMPIGDFSAGQETAPFTDYKRSLDLKTGTATVTYRQDGVNFTKEYFTNYPDNVFVMRISADKPGAVSQYIGLDGRRGKDAVSVSGDTITMTGQPNDQRENGLYYIQKLKVIPQGGSMTQVNDSLRVQNADAVVLILAAGTNYQTCADGSNNYFADKTASFQKVETRLNAAAAKGYNSLKTAHLNDYQPLFDRVKLNIGGVSMPAKTTDTLLKGYGKTNTAAEDRYAETLYYQYGRYLLLASSRAGTLPANLQGIWAWGTKSGGNPGYSADMRTQMMYWLAEPGNLGECATPMAAYLGDIKASGAKTAAHYHARENGGDVRGWTAYNNLNIWGYTAPGRFEKGYYNPAAGASLVQSVWNRYAYGRDTAFLSSNYSTILDAALFWVDNLWEDERDGKLVANPSYSPNQGEYSLGAARDQAVIWEIFETAQLAAQVLGKQNDPAVKEIAAAQAKLAGPAIGLGGQFMEWKDEVTKSVTGSNDPHTGLLYALFPGTQIADGRNQTENRIASGMRQSLAARGDIGEGWNRAWKLNLWAHLHDGDQALRLLGQMLSAGTMDNLMNKNKSFQLDGNLGAAAGIGEMLLQSRGDYIELLPAVPAAWPGGAVSGLKAHGNFEVEMEWSGRILQTASIKALSGGTCGVSYPGLASGTVKDSAGNAVTVTKINADRISFPAEAGKTYIITGVPQNQTFPDSRSFLLAIVNNLYTGAILEETKAPASLNGAGAYLQGVDAGGLAKALGMRALDIITELNGARVENTASLAALYDAVPIGGEITLKVWRENRYIKIVYTKSVNDNRVAMNNIYIEAEQYDDKINRDTPKTNGCPDTTGSGWNLGNIQGGDWVVYKGLYFLGTPQSITVRASKDAGIANVSFWIGGRNAAEGGTLIATCQIPGLTNPQHPAYSPGAGGQAGWDTYFTFTSSAITVDMTGEQDLYMVFDTSVNINWFQFNPGGEPPEVPWDGPLYQKGDVNRNGNIDIGDARLVLQHLVGKIVLDAEQSELAKVNNGLTLTIADARLILQKLVDKIDKFPVDK